jgi:hypothetical protein
MRFQDMCISARDGKLLIHFIRVGRRYRGTNVLEITTSASREIIQRRLWHSS